MKLVGREIYLDGKQIVLEYDEFELLRLLMSSPGRAFSIQEINYIVFDKRMDLGKPNTVDEHIVQLVHKLGPGIIETVPSFGYRIKELRNQQTERQMKSLRSKDGQVVQYGNVIFDHFAHAVFIDNKRIALSHLEYLVLWQVSVNPSRVFTWSDFDLLSSDGMISLPTDRLDVVKQLNLKIAPLQIWASRTTGYGFTESPQVPISENNSLPETEKTPVLRYGVLLFYPDTQTALVESRPIQLTLVESIFLRQLLENRRKISTNSDFDLLAVSIRGTRATNHLAVIAQLNAKIAPVRVARIPGLGHRLEEPKDVLEERQARGLQANNAQLIRYGPLLLDNYAHVVFVNKQPVDLTRAEYLLVAYALRNQGKGISPVDLEIILKDLKEAPGAQYIARIKRLNAKIAPAEFEIIRGFGFRLEEPLNMRRERQAASLMADDGLVFQYGPLLVDDYAHAVLLDNRPVELTPVEYLFLLFALRYRGDNFSSADLDTFSQNRRGQPVTNHMAVLESLNAKIDPIVITGERKVFRLAGIVGH